jgi:hypothetical protein
LLFTFIIMVAGILATSVSAQNEYFANQPVWTSVPTNDTYCSAVGDVDHDGDLDVVFGNKDQTNTLYLNEGGVLAENPAWESLPNLATYTIALGDIDGDGNLDVVCGDFSGGISVYLNSGGAEVFERIPAWTSGTITAIQGIILGDVDDDGDLDLVCANGGPTTPARFNGNYLYLNTDGMFESTPAWTAADSVDTRCVALGDLDGDGDLDVVFGNAGTAGLTNTAYLNVGGQSVFETTPSWRSADTTATTAVALGDINGDGALDLICGNGDLSTQKNVLYENSGAGLDTLPSWQTDAADRTTSVAVGDVEGDGDLDIMFGDYSNMRLYINESGALGPASAWDASFGPFPCRAVALADCDTDGDLDIVVSMSGSSSAQPANRVFENVMLPFAGTPAWLADETVTSEVVSVSLGDINADGHIDAVFGLNQIGKAVWLYLGDGTLFEASHSWVLEVRGRGAVCLGDVDNDGDLDLATAFDIGDVEQLGIFLNDGEVFATEPAWTSSGVRCYPDGLELADINNDGWLDVVIGTAVSASSPENFQEALVFLNTGDQNIFPNDPSWRSSDEVTLGTRAVAVADVNGDRVLDLLCSNGGANVEHSVEDRLYLGNGVVFSRNHSWATQDDYNGRWIALADTDGDGWSEYISQTTNTLFVYDNTDGVLEVNPSTSIDIGTDTGNRAARDVDGDGDIDIVTQDGVIFNNRGTLGPNEVKIWGLTGFGFFEGFELDDIDRDGDLDIVAARGAPKNVAFLGKKLPAFKGDPASPSNHTPNNGAFIKNVSTTTADPNVIHVEFTMYDVESDDVWIVPEYHFDGSWQFEAVEMTTAAGVIGPLASSPSGIAHSFDWDITRVPFDSHDAILRLRTTSNPGRVAIVQHASTYIHNAGMISPIRPAIALVTPQLDFPMVTVGDTVGVDLIVSNNGTATLAVETITLPLPADMTVDKQTPFNIEPGRADTIRVSLAPCDIIETLDDIVIQSSDPVTPVSYVAVSHDVRALAFESVLLSQEPILPLGEAVTVFVDPADGVRFQEGYVFHRSPGDAEFQDSIPLARQGQLGFIAVIPGEAVLERGLYYYVRLSNDCAITTDPRRAPEVFFTRQVSSPDVVTTTPVLTGEQGFLEGQSIRVAIGLPRGAEFVSGMLHCREGAARFFVEVPFAIEEGLPFAAIPDTLVTGRGVEYWAEVRTATATLTDPPRDPDLHPHALQVIVDDLEEPRPHPGEQYRMVSVPLDFGADFTGTLLSILSDQREFGPYDPMRWRCFRYSREDDAYRELPSEGGDDLFYLAPERGFWLISRSTHSISTSPITGTSVSTEGPYEITLEPGWNQIGHPFVFPVAWDSMTIDTLTAPAAVDSGIVQSPVGWWSGTYDYEIKNLYPFYGYWIKNLSSSAVILAVPPVEAIETATRPPDNSAPEGEGLGDWTVRIVASSGNVADRFNVVGVNENAAAGWDFRDVAEAPMSPGQMLSLYFPHVSWDAHPGVYTTDIRSEYAALEAAVTEAVSSAEDAWGQAWHFDIAKNFSDTPVGDEVTLSFEGLDDVPAGAMVHLIDHQMQQAVDLRVHNEYAFYLPERDVVTDETDARFTLVVGSEDFVGDSPLPPLPATTALHQNYPNPFNPTTLIKYDIATAGDVTIRVYDARGALVKDLYRGHRAPGRYVVSWHGDNQAGQKVASGIYFYRLETPQAMQTRKMVMLK